MDLTSLVTRAQQGDEHAFAELIGSMQAQLYRIAVSYVKNRDDALDVVGESVFRAFTSLSTLKQPQFFQTWMIRIVINQAVNVTRQKQRALSCEQVALEPLASYGTNPETNIDLYAAIDALNHNERAVIVLKYLEDLTLAQVAEVLERPLGTVKTYLHSALTALRLELKEEIP